MTSTIRLENVLNPDEHLVPRNTEFLDEHEVGLIDAELRTLLDTMIALKTRRNTFTKISLLPPEILTNIFEECALSWRAPPSPMRDGWIRVTHVCRHWRQVALACPTLWAHISTSRPHGALAFLHRSQAAPLTVVAKITDIWLSELAQLVLKQLPRIRDLELIVAGLHPHDERFSFLNNPAPHLKKLMLYNRGTGSSLPTFLLQNSFPALRSFKIHRLWMPWDSSILHGLSELCLTNIPFGHQPTMSQLMSILGSCPMLEYLGLENFAPGKITTDSSPPTPSIHLSRLRQFSISMDTHPCAELLSHLTFSTEASWSIGCLDNPNSADDNIALIVPRKTQDPMTCRSLRATISNNLVTIVAQISPVSRPALLIHTEIQLTLYRHINFTDKLSPLVEASYWSEATLFYIELCDRAQTANQSAWSKVLAALPNLRTLEVNSTLYVRSTETEEGLLNALVTPTSPDPRDSYPCQRLSQLVLANLNLSPGRGPAIDLLKGYLQLRKADRRPLKYLELRRCNGVTSGIVEELKCLVDEVAWDEVEPDDQSSIYSSELEDEDRESVSDASHYAVVG